MALQEQAFEQGRGGGMGSLGFCIGVAVLAFCCGFLGLKLHIWLPERHAPDQARDMIGAMTGLLGLLLALVLGTLVGSSYTLYATQKAEMETLAASVAAARRGARRLWPGSRARPGWGCARRSSTATQASGAAKPPISREMNVKSVVSQSKTLDQFLMSLTPKSDAQKQVLATANVAAGQIAQTRILMMLQLAGGISWPLVAIVVCWSLLLFCGYGLVSPMNATVLTTLGLGAIAVASAIFLIIELSQPYSGCSASRQARRSRRSRRSAHKNSIIMCVIQEAALTAATLNGVSSALKSLDPDAKLALKRR